MENIEELKKEFIKAYSNITRKGSKELFEWIESTDFFTAPASTRFHGNVEGGLARHSLNVYGCLRAELDRLGLVGNDKGKYTEETIAIVALLHDLTKIDTYKKEKRNVKNVMGVWEERPYYAFRKGDNVAITGEHGDESVFRIMKHMPLEDEEIMAIRAHMGGFDAAAKGGSYYTGEIFERSIIAVLLHLADVKATYLYDKKAEL